MRASPADDPGLESAEAAAYLDAWRAAPSALAAAHGISAVEVAGGVCLAVASAPESRVLNHAIGLGASGPVTDDDLDAVARFYAGVGTDHFVAARGDLAERLRLRGYRNDYAWTRFARDTSPVAARATDLRISEVREGAPIGGIIASAFGMPPAFGDWMSAIAGREGWTWLVAWSGEDPAGVGALFARGGVGWLGFGATRPEHRGRGAQGAIIAGRIDRARELGLRRVATETGVPREDGPGPSYRNILRAGFEEIEVRPNLASPPRGPR
jgi:GNAT superfamily N-acetyltransferase